MQQLPDASSLSANDCARQLLDVNLQMIAIIRRHMRSHRSGLSVPQFRTLCYVSTAAGCSLSAVAEFVGLSLAAMSRLVDGLVNDQLLERRPGNDRRHVQLSVTQAGSATVTQARQLAQAHLAATLTKLPPEKRQAIGHSLACLAAVFSPEAAQTDLAGSDVVKTNRDIDRSDLNAGERLPAGSGAGSSD